MDRNALKKLIIPLILEQLLAVSVGMVDTLMVSTVGEVAVSGVALVDNINRLVIQVLSAFAAGGVVIGSQYFGSGNLKDTRKSCAQLETLMGLFSLTAALFCAVFSRQILGAIFGSVEADVFHAASIYLVITAFSYPFLGLYNADAAIFRSFGNSAVSMRVSLIMNLLNVGFNALFVFGFGIGVAGVGFATLISRVVAALIMKYKTLQKSNPIRITEMKDYIPDGVFLWKILRIAIPGGIENGMFQIGKLLVVSMIAGLGTNAIAANAIAYQIIDFPNIPGVAIGLALVTVVGQDIGAGKKEVAKKDTVRLVKLAYLLDWSCKLTLFFLAPVLVSAFSLSEAATAICIQLLKCFAIAALPVWPLSFTLPNALRGAGDATFTMSISIGSMWLFRIVASYLLIHIFQMGVLGAWLGMFIDWYVRGFCYMVRYFSGKWLDKKAI